MALTPETGAGIPGADTYATLAECKTYAAKRGLVLPADNLIEQALVLACDFLQSLNWKGTKTAAVNPLEWPRQDVTLEDGTDIAIDAIPDVLKSAQCQLAAENAAGTDLQPTGTGRDVVREKVDVLEVEYAESHSGSVTPQFNKALAMLAPLLDSGGAYRLTVDRA